MSRAALLLALVVLLGAARWQAEPPPLAVCDVAALQAAFAAVPRYTPTDLTGYARVAGDHLTLHGADYMVRGFNYYPSRYPWRRFLTAMDVGSIGAELALMAAANANTLRIFLWHEALFQCPGSGAVPNPDAFARLDAFIHAAAARGLRLIVTLNDLPDLSAYPLYDSPPHSVAQLEYVVWRYRDEPAVLLWDVRNEGDIDYGSHPSFPAKFPRETVLRWLDDTTRRVRALDPNHPLTAGWLFNNEATAPYVDVISLHHWVNADNLRDRLDTLRDLTDKPLLVEEFGYSTYRYTRDEQMANIAAVIATAEAQRTAGWLIWTAFDFPLDATCVEPACPSHDNAEHHFGVWTADYLPKPAVRLLTR